jgi:secondary thiamine-phosphate synthase enzyme
MKQEQGRLNASTRGKGLYEITRDVRKWVGEQKIKSGLLTVFIQHTSASLVIQENADPDVRRDLAEFFERLVPENTPWFRHTTEGGDDTFARLSRPRNSPFQCAMGKSLWAHGRESMCSSTGRNHRFVTS